MIAYEKDLNQLQEFAFGIIRLYPHDQKAPQVLLALASARPVNLKRFFELNQGDDVWRVYSKLSHSGSIEQWLKDHALVAYVND